MAQQGMVLPVGQVLQPQRRFQQVPRYLVIFGLLALLLLAVGASATVRFPVRETINQISQIGQSVPQQPVAPVAVSLIKGTVNGVWGDPFEIKSLMDLPPSLPAGPGFYRQTSYGVASGMSSVQATDLAKRIFGQIDTSVQVSAGMAIAFSDPNVIFISFSMGDGNHGFISPEVLSINGGKSWYVVPSVDPRPWQSSLDVFVSVDQTTVTLYSADPCCVAPTYRKMALQRESLP